jgi:hypothetical protein
LLRILITLILKKKRNITKAIVILIRIIRLIILLTRNPKKRSNSSEISLVAFSLDPSYINLSIGSSNLSARALLQNNWGLDSIYSFHITYFKEAFISYAPITESRTITRLGGTIYCPCGKGTVMLRVKNIAGQVVSLKIIDIYHIPEYNINLLSLALLLDKRINIYFKNKNIIL